MPATDQTILIAHADNRSGLAVTRSLAQAGYSTVAGVVDSRSWTTTSRYYSSDRRTQLPDPAAEPAAFAQRTAAEANRRRCAAVLPMTDAALAALHQHEPAGCPMLLSASRAAVASVLDKHASGRLANELGVPHPATVSIDTADDIPALIGQHPLPWVFKVANRNATAPTGSEGFDVIIARDAATASLTFASLSQLGVRPLVQEFFRGQMHVLCTFAARGDVVAAHEYVSLRRSQRAGVLREITHPHPKCLAYTQQLLAALDWDGVACVQFLVDHDTDDVRFLEINGRFWASTQGSINAGWDFPAWVAGYFLDGVTPQPSALAVGSRTCYHRDDLRVLVEFLLGGPSPSLDHVPGKLEAVRNYLAAFGPSTRSDVFRWSDPLPSLADHVGLVGHWLNLALTRLKRNAQRTAIE